MPSTWNDTADKDLLSALVDAMPKLSAQHWAGAEKAMGAKGYDFSASALRQHYNKLKKGTGSNHASAPVVNPNLKRKRSTTVVGPKKSAKTSAKSTASKMGVDDEKGDLDTKNNLQGDSDYDLMADSPSNGNGRFKVEQDLGGLVQSAKGIKYENDGNDKADVDLEHDDPNYDDSSPAFNVDEARRQLLADPRHSGWGKHGAGSVFD